MHSVGWQAPLLSTEFLKEVWVIRSPRKLGLVLVHISSYYLPKSNAFCFHPIVIKMLESFKKSEYQFDTTQSFLKLLAFLSVDSMSFNSLITSMTYLGYFTGIFHKMAIEC